MSASLRHVRVPKPCCSALQSVTTPGHRPKHMAPVLRRLAAPQQTGFLLQCQRHYGNAYVQRMVSSLDTDNSSVLKKEEEDKAIQPRSAGLLADNFEAGADVETQVSLRKGRGSPLALHHLSNGVVLRAPQARTLCPTCAANQEEMVQRQAHQEGGAPLERGKEPLNFLSITPQRHQLQLALASSTAALGSPTHPEDRSRIPDAAPATPPSALSAKIAIRQTTHVPKVQTAWYNFDIPFTDYQFDPSLEGIKTAAGVVRDTAAAGLEWIVDQIKDLVDSGIEWLKDKWESIQQLASSAFERLKASFTDIIRFIKSPLSFIANAIMSLDAQALSNAWATFSRIVTSVSNGFKALADGVFGQIGPIWSRINGFATSLLNRVVGLTENFLFKRLPDALQNIAFSVINALRNLWKSINDGWNKIFGTLKSWVDRAIDVVFAFVRKALSFAMNVVIDGIIQFGKIVLFLKDLFSNPQKYVEILAQKAVNAFEGVESRFAGVVAEHFGTPAPAAHATAGTRTIHRQPAPRAAPERRRSATWSEIGSGVLEMMGKKWNEFKANPWSVLTTLLLDMVLPIVGNVKDVIHLFEEIKNIVTGPLSAGSLEELWTSFLKILDIPILIYHTVVSILMRSLTLPLIVASFIPHPVVKGIAAAVGYALLAAFVQAEVLNIGHKLALLKTGATTKSEKDAAYNRVADSLIAMAMTAVIILVMLILHFIANVMKGVYNFVKGKVFKARTAPVEARGTAGEGKGGSGETKPVEGKGAKVEVEGPTRDGQGTIKLLDDGRVIVCRSCEELRIKYSDELNAKTKDGKALTDEAQDLNTKLNEADAIKDPKDRKAAIETVEDELAKKRQARRAAETVAVKMQELTKLRETTSEAVDRINPAPEKGKTSAIIEGEAKLVEGRKSLKEAQKAAEEAKAGAKPDAKELEAKATEMEKKLNELDKAISKAKGEHRDIQSEWKAAEKDALDIEGDTGLQDPGLIDAARDRVENVRTRAKLAEKKIQDALAEPQAPREIDIHGQKLKSSYGPDAEKWLADHPNYVDKFNNAMEKGAVAPTGQNGIVPSELGPPYKYKLKILGEGGNYRIHGRVEGDRIIWDKVLDHD